MDTFNGPPVENECDGRLHFKQLPAYVAVVEAALTLLAAHKTCRCARPSIESPSSPLARLNFVTLLSLAFFFPKVCVNLILITQLLDYSQFSLGHWPAALAAVIHIPTWTRLHTSKRLESVLQHHRLHIATPCNGCQLPDTASHSTLQVSQTFSQQRHRSMFAVAVELR